MRLNNTQVVMQRNVPLSKSKLWNFQRAFFDTQGINAWNHKVPFYITSNPYIANAYANICIRFMQDCVNKGNYNPEEPFYIFELGAGPGRFSFYTIKRLLELQKMLALKKIKFIYVMSDFTQNIIQYWSQHPQLQPYLRQGILDFSLFDAEREKQIKLIYSGKILEKLSMQAKNANPLIIIANYVFDTLSHDVFQVIKGNTQEGLIKLVTTPDNLKEGLPSKLETIEAQFSYRNIDLDYYEDANFNAVLAYYANHYVDLRFLLPIGSLRCIKQLQQIAGNRLLLIATDKGYTDNHEQYSQREPGIAFHASFSMMVNFHAIGQYFKQYKGDYYYQFVEQGIVSAAFVLGDKFNALPETYCALNANFENFGPGNLYNILNYIRNTQAACDLEIILDKLNISNWDPELFNACSSTILEKINNCEPRLFNKVAMILPKIAENYYALSGNDDTLFNIGHLFQAVGDYAKALLYYLQSYSNFNANPNICDNIGICYFNLHHYEQAKTYFQKALTINPNNIAIHGWLAHVNEKLSS